MEFTLAAVAAISQLSWRTWEEGLTLACVRHELGRISALPSFSRWATIVMVGLGLWSDSAYCRGGLAGYGFNGVRCSHRPDRKNENGGLGL